jgi:hypothetical protein
LAYRLALQGSYDCKTAGMFGEAAMAEPWDGVGIAAMAGIHMAQEEASGWVRCSLVVKPQLVRYKLDETIEQP